MQVETTVSGIPCLVEVERYFVQKPDYNNDVSDFDYYGYSELDFVIKDRKGYLAKWLERKLTDADIDRIKVEVEAAYIQEAYDDF